MDNCTAVVLVKNDEYWLRYALESTRSLFKNYVIYDINSEDETLTVINEFCSTLDDSVTVKHRALPECPPSVQGTFRNSMIAEALTDWYFILDGDEVYSDEAVKALEEGFSGLVKAHQNDPRKIYGVIQRLEVGPDLKTRFNELRTHHRLYHRTAVWVGPHPGEAPFFDQNSKREFHIDALCHHFHHPKRSRLDHSVPKRLERRGRTTYSPGELISYDLLENLPISRVKWPYLSPELDELQNANPMQVR